MKYPCEIIKDLIPLHIDKLLSKKSEQAVKEHLNECETCTAYYNEIQSENCFSNIEACNTYDRTMVDSLKNIKSKISKKIKRTIVFAVSFTAVFTGLVYILFNTPIKTLNPIDVQLSAEVYPIRELTSFESDEAENYTIKIPSHSDIEINVPKEIIDKDEYISLVNISSDYFIREIEQNTKDDTLYIKSIRTTLFSNKSENYKRPVTSVEFCELNKIVYVSKDGSETILWEK